MNTYGLTHLLTNNAQGTTRKSENTKKLEKLEEKQPEIALKFRNYFKENKLKLLNLLIQKK